MSRESTPMPTNTARQPVVCAAQASGVPADIEPTLPMNMTAPVSVAKRLSSYQTAISLSMAMKATETPSPASVRPATAISKLGARPKIRLPTPAMRPPRVRILRGPSVSASTPVGICINV